MGSGGDISPCLWGIADKRIAAYFGAVKMYMKRSAAAHGSHIYGGGQFGREGWAAGLRSIGNQLKNRTFRHGNSVKNQTGGRI